MSAGGLRPFAASVGTTAVQLTTSKAMRRSIIVKNNATATNILFIADDLASATLADGFPLEPGESYKFEDFSGALWAISDTAATPVRVLEVG